MHSVSTREQAVTLRTQGYSYVYISGQLGISKSTLSDWLTSVPYAPNAKTLESHGTARTAASARKAKIRQEQIANIEQEAGKEIGRVTDRDLFMFGLGLYMGEGTKSYSVTCVSNADPRVINAAIAWFSSLGVRKDQFSPRLHVYPDTDIAECLQFWSKTTRISIFQFQKTYVDVRVGKKSKKQGILPHGTLHLGVRGRGRKEFGVAFFRKIQAWNKDVLEKVDKRD